MLTELKFEPQIEREFRGFYSVETRQLARIALVLGLLFEFGRFAVDTSGEVGGLLSVTAALRLFLVSSVIGVALFSTGNEALVRFSDALIFAAAAAISCATLLSSLMRAASGLAPLYLEIAAVIVLVNVLLGMRFLNALWLTAPLFATAIVAGGLVPQPVITFAYSSLSLSLVAFVAAAGCFRLEQSARAMFLHRRSASDLVGRDDSTGIPNRRLFLEHLQSTIGQAERESQGLATAMVRIDDFEAFEKQYGTEAADACLRRIAHALMRAGRRPLDYTARYSPKDYAVLFYDPSGKSITETVGRIRRQVAMLDIPNEATPDSKRVTVSIGVAVSPRGRKHYQRGVLTCAARALEKAQNLGRDKMVVEEVPERRSTAQILTGPWRAATRG
ncbi:MAG: diguanylate cyclase domain-containing protein [Gammaproteobacteria bacterium]